MSIFIYTHRHPLRTYQETYAKIVYLLVGLAMFTVLLVTFRMWVVRVDNVFVSFWSNGDYELKKAVAEILANCEYSDSMRISGRRIQATVTDSTNQYLLLSAAELQNQAFGVSWPAVVLSIINKLLYRANWWFFRWGGFVIKTNIILPTIEVVFHLWAIVAIANTIEPCAFVSDYIDTCTKQRHATMAQLGVAGDQIQVDHNFDQSLVGLLIVLCINLGVILLALIRVACDGMEEDNRKWGRIRYKGFHRKAKKGMPGPEGNDANDDLVPPRLYILRALREYPDLLREAVQGEMRIDPADGNPYTRDEFYAQYNSYAEWEAAQPWRGGALPSNAYPPAPPSPGLQSQGPDHQPADDQTYNAGQAQPGYPPPAPSPQSPAHDPPWDVTPTHLNTKLSAPPLSSDV